MRGELRIEHSVSVESVGIHTSCSRSHFLCEKVSISPEHPRSVVVWCQEGLSKPVPIPHILWRPVCEDDSSERGLPHRSNACFRHSMTNPSYIPGMHLGHFG